MPLKHRTHSRKHNMSTTRRKHKVLNMSPQRKQHSRILKRPIKLRKHNIILQNTHNNNPALRNKNKITETRTTHLTQDEDANNNST